jgi:hypothetical protein
MSSKVCPQCLTPFLGRTDKKYCSDDCRAQANRQKTRITRQPSIITNEILWRNREILRTFWQDRPTMVSRETLLIRGFRAEYHTNLYITSPRNTYFVCYDFGFQPCLVSGTKMALVVKLIGHTTTDAWNIDLIKN